MKPIISNYIIGLIILCLTGFPNARLVPYISPGVFVGWNFSNSATITFKVSIGIASDISDYSSDNNGHFVFANVTLGERKLFNYSDKQTEYTFTEFETGFWTSHLVSGLGLGTAYYKSDDKWHIAPKASLFTGDLMFLRSDFILYKQNLNADVGGIFVIPIGSFLKTQPSVGFGNFMGE